MSPSHQPASRKEPAANTFTHTPGDAPHPESITAFAAAVHRAAMRLLRAKGRPAFEADDLAQEVVLRFLLKPAEYMVRYTPERFARVCINHVAEDVARKNRSDRGEGANLESYVDEHGQPAKRKRREVVSGSATGADGERELFDTVTDDHSSFEDRLVDELDGAQRIEAALQRLTPRQAYLVQRVDGEGYSVAEAATSLGLQRETASRCLNAARRVLASQGGVS